MGGTTTLANLVPGTYTVHILHRDTGTTCWNLRQASYTVNSGQVVAATTAWVQVPWRSSSEVAALVRPVADRGNLPRTDLVPYASAAHPKPTE